MAAGAARGTAGGEEALAPGARRLPVSVGALPPAHYPARRVEQIGQYRILGELGRGGAGAVYRAAHASGALVALKQLHERGPAALARFEREAGLMAQLQGTPGVVPLLDAGASPRGPFFTMPLFPGGDLEARLRRGPLPLAEAERLARELAQALAWIHRAGLVHRDLKPSNVLFDEAGGAWVADLGLAKLRGAEDGLSKTNETRGTPGYMAPEQFADAKRAGPAADVFAWGAIVYRALTGAEAFAGATTLERAAATAKSSPAAPVALRPEVPPALSALVLHALAKEPGQRPRDGQALLEGLERCRARRPAPTSAPSRGPGLAGALWGLGGAALGVLLALGWSLRADSDQRLGPAGSPPSGAPAPSLAAEAATPSPAPAVRHGSGALLPGSVASRAAGPARAPQLAQPRLPAPTAPDEAEARVRGRLRELLAPALAERGLDLLELRGDPRGKVGAAPQELGWLPSGELACGHQRLPPRGGRALWSIFDAQSGALLRRLALSPSERAGFVHPSGLLCTLAREEIRGYDPSQGLLRRKLKFGASVILCRVSASGGLVAALTRAGKVSAIELREWGSGELRWRVELSGPIRQLLLNEPLGRLAVVTRQGLRALDLQSGRQVGELLRLPVLQSIARTPDGKALLGLEHRPPLLHRWDFVSGEELGAPLELTPPRLETRARLACAGDEALVTLGPALERVSLAEWRITETRVVSPYVVERVALAPDGAALFATRGGALQRWPRGGAPLWPRDLSARVMAFALPDPERLSGPLYLGGRELARLGPEGERRVLYQGRGPVSWLRAARVGQALLFLADHEPRARWWTPEGLEEGPQLDPKWPGVLLSAERAVLASSSAASRRRGGGTKPRLLEALRGRAIRALAPLRGRALALGVDPAGGVLLAGEAGLSRYDLERGAESSLAPLETKGLAEVRFEPGGQEVLLVYQAPGKVRLERRRASDGALVESLSLGQGGSPARGFVLRSDRVTWLSGIELGCWRRGQTQPERRELPLALGAPRILEPGPRGSLYVVTSRGLVARLRLRGAR